MGKDFLELLLRLSCFVLGLLLSLFAFMLQSAEIPGRVLLGMGFGRAMVRDHGQIRQLGAVEMQLIRGKLQDPVWNMVERDAAEKV